jgi:asparagine synthase (glutamine-hydrolysing)
LKALCAHPKFDKRINRKALNGYMRVAAVSAPHSIYEDVYMLPPGHRICISTDTLDRKTNFLELMQPYWSPKTTIQSAQAGMTEKPEDEMIDEFETILSACVKDRMMSDVPLGAFLSGGIDSSSVVALMQAQSSSKIKTYTIGFEEAGFNEAEYAKDVATHLQTDHHELYLSAKDAMDIIPDLPQMYDEPLGDSSAIPTFLVSQFARQDVTVALSGDGGDEMLGGYNRHIQGPEIWKAMQFIPHPLRKLMTRTVQGVQTETWDRLRSSSPQFGRKIHKAAGIFALKDPEQIYNGLLTQWDNADDVVLHSLTHRHEFDFPENLSMAEKMMFADFTTYMHHSILTKVDRASMAVSLEARAPLLDRRVFNYAWQLPMHMKIRGDKGKYLLREVLARHIPRHLFERPKQGFSIPVGDWLRGPLKDWANDLLNIDTLKSDGIFNPEIVQSVWQEHLNGHGNHSERLWTILMFQAWKNKWL